MRKRFELVMLDADTCAEGCLEKVGPRRGDAVPAERVIVRRESIWWVEPTAPEQTPVFGRKLRVQLLFPDHLERPPKVVGIDA